MNRDKPIPWVPEVETDAQETVTAIWVWETGPVTRKDHLSMLETRVRKMIMAEGNPQEAAESLADHMEAMGLAPYGQAIRSPETAADDLIVENPRFQEYLNLVLTKEFPKGPVKASPRAKAILEDDKDLGLSHWMENLINP